MGRNSKFGYAISNVNGKGKKQFTQRAYDHAVHNKYNSNNNTTTSAPHSHRTRLRAKILLAEQPALLVRIRSPPRPLDSGKLTKELADNVNDTRGLKNKAKQQQQQFLSQLAIAAETLLLLQSGQQEEQEVPQQWLPLSNRDQFLKFRLDYFDP